MSYIDWIHKTWTSEKFSSYSVRPPLASTSRISPARFAPTCVAAAAQPPSHLKRHPQPHPGHRPCSIHRDYAVRAQLPTHGVLRAFTTMPPSSSTEKEVGGSPATRSPASHGAASCQMPLSLRHMECSMFCCFIHDPIYA